MVCLFFSGIRYIIEGRWSSKTLLDRLALKTNDFLLTSGKIDFPTCSLVSQLIGFQAGFQAGQKCLELMNKESQRVGWLLVNLADRDGAVSCCDKCSSFANKARPLKN